ncbi:hypothetical protein JYT72_00975 [Crocinitomix catalasitica]|nr:hypothetical protein [Crocinitomix catalasitica]
MIKQNLVLIRTFTFLLFSILLIQCTDATTQTEIAIAAENEKNKQIGEMVPIEFLDDVDFSEPINFKNLQLFMISGETSADNLNYVPLNVALENNWVEIIETSEVNELAITNTSDEIVFIHAGDIIKGGKQDRTLAYDMIIGPKTKKEKLVSFCVESGRWSKRGEENSDYFASNTKMLSSRKQKIAATLDGEQGSVWSGVSDQQSKLSANMSYYYNTDVNVTDNESASSLELTLDNEELAEMKTDYLDKFKSLIKENTIGFAYAINGELYNVNIYNNKQLFVDLYDKLLTAAIVEAIADLDNDQEEHKYITAADVKAALLISIEAEGSTENLNNRTSWTSESDVAKAIFTSSDRKNEMIWVHRNIIIKDPKVSEVENNEGLEIQDFIGR